MTRRILAAAFAALALSAVVAAPSQAAVTSEGKSFKPDVVTWEGKR